MEGAVNQSGGLIESQAPLYDQLYMFGDSQGYLAHKKLPPPLGPPYDPRYSPTVGS